MRTVVLIPYRDDGHRGSALAWVRARWQQAHPDWPVVIGTCGPGPWCKADALADALAQAPDAQILVVADADVWCQAVAQAVAAVEGGAAWAIPHRLVHRLSVPATAAVLAGTPPAQAGLAPDGHAEPAYTGFAGGGITVLPRSTYHLVPQDSRFAGWGGEDESWALALSVLAGKPWRGNADLWHLWHPPAERAGRRWGCAASRALVGRYRAAAGTMEAMAALLAEFTTGGGYAR